MRLDVNNLIIFLKKKPVDFLQFPCQVIDNDNGAHMRPMPGMISVVSGPSVITATFLLSINSYLKLFWARKLFCYSKCMSEYICLDFTS